VTYDCGIPDPKAGSGCCIDWCAITRDDVRCLVGSLLPPGEMWRKDERKLIHEFFDVIADELHSIIERACWMVRESDPCTAVDTLHDWADLYGVPRDECGLLTGCNDTDLIEPLLQRMVCALQMLEYGAVPNCCWFTQVGELFGADVCCIPPGQVNSDLFGVGCDGCQDDPQRFPFYTYPDFAPAPGCPDPRTESCCDDDDIVRFRANCSGPCDPLCDAPPLRDRLRDNGIMPTAIIIRITPPPGSDIEFQPNCSGPGDRLCFNPVAAAVECVIKSALPAGVQACFVRGT